MNLFSRANRIKSEKSRLIQQIPELIEELIAFVQKDYPTITRDDYEDKDDEGNVLGVNFGYFDDVIEALSMIETHLLSLKTKNLEIVLNKGLRNVKLSLEEGKKLFNDIEALKTDNVEVKPFHERLFKFEDGLRNEAQKTAVWAELETRSAELQNQIDGFQNDIYPSIIQRIEDSKTLLKKANEEGIRLVTEYFSNIFDTESTTNLRIAERWQIAFWTSIALVVFSSLAFFFYQPPAIMLISNEIDGLANEMKAGKTIPPEFVSLLKDKLSIVYWSYTVLRILILSILFYAMNFTHKNYRIRLHQYFVNRHRHNVLKVFDEFKSKGDDESKKMFLMEIAKTIFANQSTGLEGDPSSPTDMMTTLKGLTNRL